MKNPKAKGVCWKALYCEGSTEPRLSLIFAISKKETVELTGLSLKMIECAIANGKLKTRKYRRRKIPILSRKFLNWLPDRADGGQ